MEVRHRSDEKAVKNKWKNGGQQLPFLLSVFVRHNDEKRKNNVAVEETEK